VDPDPAAYWREMEELGVEPLRRLVELLALPVGSRQVDGGLVFSWPAVASFDDWESAPETDRQALQDLFTSQDLERFAAENRYLGGSVVIDGNGEWLVYLPGEGN
jgi:hypothetical protein